MRSQSGQGTSINISDVVNSGLERAKIDALKFFPNRGHTVESKSTQLNLLAGGNVENAISKPSGKLGYGVQLLRRYETVGHADAHHELPRRRPAEENSNPFQEFFFCWRERLRAALDNLCKVFAYAQAVAIKGGLIAFDSIAY
jgi:hypothetical protein